MFSVVIRYGHPGQPGNEVKNAPSNPHLNASLNSFPQEPALLGSSFGGLPSLKLLVRFPTEDAKSVGQVSTASHVPSSASDVKPWAQ